MTSTTRIPGPAGDADAGRDPDSELHAQYRGLLEHERRGIQLERELWATERAAYTKRIRALEDELWRLRQTAGTTGATGTVGAASPRESRTGVPSGSGPVSPRSARGSELPETWRGGVARRRLEETDDVASLLAAARQIVGPSNAPKGRSPSGSIAKERVDKEEEEKVPLVLKKTSNFGEEFGKTWARPRWE